MEDNLNEPYNVDYNEYGSNLPEDDPMLKKPRNRFGNSRGIRSKPATFPVQDSAVVKKNLNDHVNGNRQMPNGVNRPESLWDLELEKEEYEAYRFKRQTLKNQSNADVLPAISTTGILLPPLNRTTSAIDFVFVMNVRESERYPPLLLKEDIACVEDKMQGFQCKYQHFFLDFFLSLESINKKNSLAASETELRILERKFFKQCLNKRLQSISPPYQRYETQIVVTRIRIECKCSDSLNPSKEKCSELNTMDRQGWPEYMGLNKNGAFFSR